MRRPDPSRLVVACFSRHRAALDWAGPQLAAEFGPIISASPDFDFHHTDYYAKEMGEGLIKRLIVFAPLRPSDILPAVKAPTASKALTMVSGWFFQ